MTDYLLYATGSAKPIQGANITFLVTADSAPLFTYFYYGLGVGVLLVLLGVAVGKALRRKGNL